MATHTKSSNPLFKIALLSMSIMLTTSGAIASTVSLMAKTFTEQSQTSVEALVTASNFTVMIFVLLSSFFVKAIGTRKTVLLGLLLSFFAGIFPIFSDNYILIYASRLVLGVGFGLFNSLAVSLIGKYYEGEEKAKMIGWQSAIQSAGQTLVTFLVGILMLNNWHLAFAANFIGIIPVILFMLWGPKDSDPGIVENSPESKTTERVKQSVNAPVILQAIALLILFAFLMVFFLKSSVFVIEQKFDNPSFIGIVLSIFTLVSIIANLFYGKVVQVTKHLSLPISCFLTGIGFILLSMTTNFKTFTLVVILIGLGSSLLLPYSWGLIMNKAPKNSINLAISIAMVGTNLGSFLAPYFGKIPALLSGNDSASFAFVFAGGVMILFGAIYVFVGKRLSLD